MEVLHQLIRGMSMAEKSYLKRYAGKLSDDSATNYLQLFDAIAAQEDYDEKALKKKFARQQFVKQFSVAKTYLYKTIIKALKNFHEESDVQSQLRHLQLELAILMDKGIYAQAYKIIGKGESLAKDYEMFSEWAEFLRTELYLLVNGYHKTGRSVAAVVAEQEVAEVRLQNLIQFENLYNRQHRLSKMVYQLRDGQQLAEYELIFCDNLLKQEKKAFSKRALYYYYYIRALHFSVTDKRKEFLAESKLLAKVCEQTPYFLKFDLRASMNAINLLLEACYFNHDYSSMQKALTQLNMLNAQNERDKIAQFVYYSRFGLIYYDQRKDVKGKASLIEEAWKLMRLYGPKIPYHIRISTIVTYVSALLEMGEYAKALDWIEIYRQGKKEDETRYDVQSILLMMQLIAHYELGNHLLVKNIVPNISRFIRKVGQQSSFEKVLLSFFAKLTSAQQQGNKVFEDALKGLNALNSVDILNRNRPMHGVFKMFIESKMKGRKYHERAGN